MWLALEDKILTWNNLIKRGKVGPSIYVLCCSNEDSMDHIFTECKTTRKIWSIILQFLDSVYEWRVGKLEQSFGEWHHKAKCHKFDGIFGF
jgi:hypothetical protein